MTTSITATAEHGSLPATRQTDLEEAWMDSGTAPMWPLFQALINSRAFAAAALATHLEWDGVLALAPGGTASTFSLAVGAIRSAVFYDGSKYVVRTAAATTIGSGAIEGAPGSLSADAWYYLYAFDNAGTLDYELSTTGLAANGINKSGDASRMYLGCIKSLPSTGAPIPFRKARGRVVYRVSGGSATVLKVVDDAADTSYTAADCAGLVPPHARLATLRVNLISTTGTSQNYGYVQTNGDSGADAFELHVDAVSGSSDNLTLDIETDSSRRIQYKVSNVTSAPHMHAWVTGFYE